MKVGYFFDVDGTLYDHKFHECSPNTLKALEALHADGNVVIAATSRAQAEWQHLPGKLRNFAFDAKIFDGGPLIVDGHQKVLKESCFASDVSENVL